MSAQSDPFLLARFLDAQEHAFDAALAELRAGHKSGHWIWYVFPQIAGLGRSAMSERYGLSGVAEAAAYLAHPVLGDRLQIAIEAISAHRSVSAEAVLGELDAMKFRSCLTLFQAAAPNEPIFSEALERFFAGRPDPKTLEVLGARGKV